MERAINIEIRDAPTQTSFGENPFTRTWPLLQYREVDMGRLFDVLAAQSAKLGVFQDK